MGIAILSGTIASLEPQALFHPLHSAKWESHTPGTSTPTSASSKATPTHFIACVSRAQSVTNLLSTFNALGPRGETVEVVAGANVQSVQRADVVLLA